MDRKKEIIQKYHQELEKVFKHCNLNTILEIHSLFEQVREADGTIFSIGNGGSSSTASHFAADLVKNSRKHGKPDYRVMCLSDNIPTLTAFANDEAYDEIFAAPLKVFYKEGDVLVAISTSGNSPNVLRAAEYIKRKNGKVISLTGIDGGKLAAFSDFIIKSNSPIIEHVETHHLAIVQLFVVLAK